MITDKLNEILASQGTERKRLVREFQAQIWDGKTELGDPASEVLSDLAYDLDFYEPDKSLRSEDPSYYSDDKLEIEIRSALKRLEAVQNPE